MPEFEKDLKEIMELSMSDNFTDNWDFRRFGPQQTSHLQHDLKQFVKKVLSWVGVYKRAVPSEIWENIDKLEWVYSQLKDEESRKTLVDVMAYRLLGYSKIKLALNTPDYWKTLDNLEKMTANADSIDLGFNNWRLHKISLASIGYPMELFIRPSGIMTQLILQQYRCTSGNTIIEASPGDTIIDAGACYGETALYFACKAGPAGQVFSFEFLPENLRIFQKNMQMNRDIASTVHLIENPLWSSSGLKLFIEVDGPGTRVTPMPKNSTAQEIKTVSIDDVANENNLRSVDFIKMDIEGAELDALKGAEKSIRSFKPKLAISVYHNLFDFWTIPQWIDSLGLGYQFYLRHFTIHAEETVMFAVAPPK